ncbi:Scd6-like Sm domain-containing protein [Chytridium lagenaria]|nr:Scd6-like Sm domain-containing protein [Chytridium lagenaria]
MAFVGSTISLISTSEVRYVGVLHSVNPVASTVALEQVRSYGTEGRIGDPAQEMPGSDRLFEFIVFRGGDIKDLKVLTLPPTPTQPPPNVPNDPAIISVGNHPGAYAGPPGQSATSFAPVKGYTGESISGGRLCLT